NHEDNNETSIVLMSYKMSIFAVIFQLAENVVDVRVLKSDDVFDLIGDVDPTDEDGDIGMDDSTAVSVSLDLVKSSREERNVRNQTLVIVITLEMEVK
nr:hypothetical protein [Tanacetum cinerariifolium]